MPVWGEAIERPVAERTRTATAPSLAAAEAPELRNLTVRP
jgi:hypothetical protein